MEGIGGRAAETPPSGSAPGPAPPAPGSWRAWLSSFTDARALYRWGLIGVTVGVIAGLVAVAFYAALELATDGFLGVLIGTYLPQNGAPVASGFDWSTDPARFFLLIGLLAGGGAAVGLLTSRLAPEVAGHGTDEAIKQFHRGRGVVRYRVPPLKFLASAITLGTGGSGGREGPTAQIGSGIASLVARPLGLTVRERRIALMVGLGAGIGAIFKAPFGAALLSAEILYLADFEPDVIMPSIVASVISYSIFGSVVGFQPEFALPAGVGWTVEQLPVYALLGLVAGVVGILYVLFFHGTRRRFERSRLPPWSRPAVGAGLFGAAVVALYYLVPIDDHLLSVGALGIGYGMIQWLMSQSALPTILLALLVGLIVLKIVGTSLTVGSGGSTGLFGPGMVIGALLGFTVAGIANHVVPSLFVPADLAAFGIIGMMAFYGSVSRAPIALILMVVEMTGSEALIVPAMIAIFIAYYVAAKHPIYTEQVADRLASPAHTSEYFAEFLRHVPTSEAMGVEVPTVPSTTVLADAQRALARSPVSVLAVVDAGRLVGEIRLVDLLNTPLEERRARPVATVLRDPFLSVTPTTSLLEALGRMEQEQIEALLVVDPTDTHRLAGVVTREAIASFQRSPHARGSQQPTAGRSGP